MGRPCRHWEVVGARRVAEAAKELARGDRECGETRGHDLDASRRACTRRTPSAPCFRTTLSPPRSLSRHPSRTALRSYSYCRTLYTVPMASYTQATTPPSEPLTMVYKVVNNLPIHIDIYAPTLVSSAAPAVPAVVYFHGGALTVGNRKSWFPAWLHRACLKLFSLEIGRAHV